MESRLWRAMSGGEQGVVENKLWWRARDGAEHRVVESRSGGGEEQVVENRRWRCKCWGAGGGGE